MRHFLIKTFFILALFYSFSYAQTEKNFLGLGVSGHFNGGGFYGEYQYKLHKNFSIGANVGMSFTQKNDLNLRSFNANLVDALVIYYDKRANLKFMPANNAPLVSLFLNLRVAFHYADLVGLGKNFDLYSGFAVGPSFFLTDYLDYINVKNYIDKDVYNQFNANNNNKLKKNSKLVGLRKVDYHLAFFSGFRYFFTNYKLGIQTELALGYNMNALKIGAIWKL